MAIVLAKQPIHVADLAALLALPASQLLAGDTVIRDDNDHAYMLIGDDPGVFESWKQLDNEAVDGSGFETPSGAQTKADAAQAAAIAAAAADATTKANSAQSAAISAAATDATTKASSAQSSAIAAASTDATTKASAAQSAAVAAAATDATTKANAAAASAASALSAEVTRATTAEATKANSLVEAASVYTSNFTAAVDTIHRVDTTAGAVVATLPTAPADKSRFTIKLIIQGSTNAVTVTCGGSDVINKTGGGTSYTLSLVNQAVTFQYKATGAIYTIVSSDMPLSQLDARFAAVGAPPAATPWAATTAYAVNALVSYQGGVYRARTAHTSGATFVPDKWFVVAAPGVVNWYTMPVPLIVAHRGGGQQGFGPVPENMLEGSRALISGGVKAVNPDMRACKDGGLIAMHDTTLDRTTNVTGNVSDYWSHDLDNVTLNTASSFGPGWPSNSRVPTLDDFIRLTAGRAILAAGSYSTNAGTKMLSIVQAMGLNDILYIDTSDKPEAIAIANAGGHVAYWVNNTTTVSAIIASGFTPAMGDLQFDFEGTALGANLTAMLSACYAANFWVNLYTVKARWQLDVINTAHAAALAATPGTTGGIRAITTDEPLYCDVAQWVPSTKDSWARGRFGHGFQVGAGGATTRCRFVGTGIGPSFATGGNQWMRIGEVSPLPATFTLTVNAGYDGASSSSSSYISIPFCVQSDANYATALPNGYELRIKQDGTITVHKVTAGAPGGALGTLATAALVQGTSIPMSIQVTATTIIIKRVDTNQTMSTVTDSTYRTGFLFLGRVSSGSTLVVADGVTTSGSAVVTSATASFATSTDKDKSITGTGIPASTRILSVDSATQVTLSANATASGTGVSLTVGRNTLDVKFDTLVIA